VVDWKRWKWGYWVCLILLGVINVIKGKYDGAAFFFGIVAVWATATEWFAPTHTVAVCFPRSIKQAARHKDVADHTRAHALLGNVEHERRPV